VVWQVIIELWGHCFELGEIAPCHVGEIMVLVVVSHVPGEPIEGAVVRVGFSFASEHIVLRNEVGSTRVKRASEEITDQEIPDGTHAKIVDHQCIERKDDCPIVRMPLGEHLLLDKHGADGVKQNLTGRKENLAEYVGEEDALYFGGEVSIYTLQTLVLVVFKMVTLERSRVGNSNRDVDEKGKVFVVVKALEC